MDEELRYSACLDGSTCMWIIDCETGEEPRRYLFGHASEEEVMNELFRLTEEHRRGEKQEKAG